MTKTGTMIQKNGDDLIILCRECDKYYGRGTVIYIVDNGGIPINYLSLRSRLNPELKYFAVLKSRYENDKEEIETIIMNLEKHQEFAIQMDVKNDNFLESQGIILL